MVNNRFSTTSIWAFSIVLLIGIFLRINAALYTTVDAPLRADAGEYFTYAYNLRHSGVYSRDRIDFESEVSAPKPDALRSPGYPLFLTLFAASPPDGIVILRIMLIQALLSACLIPLTFWIARQVMSANAALLPALLVAISPQLIAMTTYILSETLFAFLLLGGTAALVRGCQGGFNSFWALMSGLLIGLAALTRPTLQYAWILVFISLVVILPKGHRLKVIAGFILGYSIIVFPWHIRNINTLGVMSDPTLSTTSIIHGHYPNMMFEGRQETFGYPYRFDPEITNLSASPSAAISGVMNRVLEQPSTYLKWYLLGKPASFFGWSDAASTEDFFTYPTLTSPYYGYMPFIITKNFMKYSHVFWVVGAWLVLFSFILFYRRIGEYRYKLILIILSTFMVYFLAVHLVAFPLARYFVPLLPIAYVMASFGVSRVFDHFKERFRKSMPEAVR